MAERELHINIETLAGGSDAEGRALNDLMDAIDLASDQDQMTWLVRHDGKRIAAIVPADVAQAAEEAVEDILEHQFGPAPLEHPSSRSPE
jgi:hypothetical protein